MADDEKAEKAVADEKKKVPPPPVGDREARPPVGDREARPPAGDREARPPVGDREARPPVGDREARRVAKALERAREVVRKDARAREGRWLAVVPIGIALLMFLLMMPRPAAPEDVPLPMVDERAFAALVKADAARAASAKSARLPSDVLSVGTALRAMNTAIVKDERVEVDDAKRKLDAEVRSALARPEALEELRALRAVQLEAFLSEALRFEQTGQESEELHALAGPFVSRMRDAGWIDANRVLLDEAERRVAYKLVWNTLTAVDAAPGMGLELDEQRVLYRLYLSRPHPSELEQAGLAAQRREAKTPADCERWAAHARRASEQWRADKIRRLAAIDPEYPAAYALGVVLYRAGNYESSIDAFRAWTDKHPDGTWTARARNHLQAAVAAYGSI